MSKTIGETLKERNSTHGDYSQQCEVTATIKNLMRHAHGNRHIAPELSEAIDMIAVKLGRIAAGNPNEIDHYHDIAGYATLAENFLRTVQVPHE